MKHFDARLHVQGNSVFTGDVREPAGTLHAWVFTSPSPHAEILSISTGEAAKAPGVARVITAGDIPGENQIGSIIMDEELLASRSVHYHGQPVALILAESLKQAREAGSLISMELRELPSVTDPRDAFSKGLLLATPVTFSCGDTDMARKRCEHVITGRADTGGQEHLYLETQCSLCVPGEDGTYRITSSTQGPSFVQKTAARVLGTAIHKVQVDVPRLGGAFGGKEDQATPWAVMTALGARLTGRPVKLALSRHDDMSFTGKRHPYSSDFTIGLNGDGRIMLWEVDYYQNGGAAGDLSTAIMERTLFHSTGSYHVPNVRATGYCCRTNLAPNTAFRGFGGPQAMFVMEAAIHKASIETGIPAEVIQERNLLGQGDAFPYGMEYQSDEVRSSWKLCSLELESVRNRTEEHNRANTRMKKGFAMMPVCFGISFTTTFLNQANALVHVYTDGSVGISTGAVEMGQGVNSRIRQVAARTLGIPVELTRVESTNTSRNANTSATAASSGADMNGNAAAMACGRILERMLNRAAQELGCSSGELAMTEGILSLDGRDAGMTWQELAGICYVNRTSLSAHAHYATPDIYFDRRSCRGKPFAYHVAGAALTEVTVDCLLGTFTVDRVRVVHHGGDQLNPLIDRGQVEGALIQGIGWVSMEELQWDSDSGRLLTGSLATYKVPDVMFTPEMEIIFAQGDDLADNVGLKGSKAIGEPPFMYGIGTWFAVASAMLSHGCELEYTAPMTNERLLMSLRDGPA